MEAVQENLLITKRFVILAGRVLNDGLVTDKGWRSIYYDNPGLFGTQAVVNAIVDDIAYTIGVDRTALHVVCHSAGHNFDLVLI